MFGENELNQLYQYATSLTNNEELAYDLVHSCIEKIITKSFILNRMAYAKRTIRNSFFDLVKSKHYKTSIPLHDESIIDESSLDIDNKLAAERLLKQLKPKERELLFLTYVQGYTTKEIAHLTNTPRGTITSQLKRLKDMIRQKYGGYNG